MDNIQHLLKIIKYALILAIVILIINFLTPISNSITNLLDRLAPSSTAEVVSSQAIVSSLRGIGRLVTVTSDEHVWKFHIGVKQGIWIFDGLGSYGADHIAEGIIEAGIDFTKIRSDSLNCEDTCTLIVPHPTITNCAIVSLKQTDQSFAIGRRDWELLEELGRIEAIKKFIDVLMEEHGILDKAKEETQLVLGEFVSGLTGKPVHVAFDDKPEELEYGDTCRPEPPFGWSKEDGEWSRND